jgi:hypothetical protein
MIDQVKLLLSYDIKGGRENAYRRFILEEFLPKAQELGLMPTDAWHTAYGKYPTRLIGFVADDLPTARVAMAGEEWKTLMQRLHEYTLNLTLRIVAFRGGLQW